MAKKPIKITEVVLRDAHQSLLATRMTMDEMRPILPEMDKIPYFSVECWGGATFDSCLRYLSEDPWERLRGIRKAMPNTKLQTIPSLTILVRCTLSARTPVTTFIISDMTGWTSSTVFTACSPMPENAHIGSL